MTDRTIPTEALRLLDREPRHPLDDPTLGIDVDVPSFGDAPNRLVTIGDSLTHGFRSFAVFDTQHAYPVLIAKALGLAADQFRFPRYDEAGACGGLPLNLEWLLRELEKVTGTRIGVFELPALLVAADHQLNKHEAHWENVARVTPPKLNHNLAMYGFDLHDALNVTARDYKQQIAARPPHDDRLFPAFPDDCDAIAGLRVLDSPDDALTQLGAARKLGAEGVETLIVFLGANNALNTVVSLSAVWAEGGEHKRNIWLPDDFKTLHDQLVAEVREVGARHVLWVTIPHVTIAPLAHGVNRLPDHPAYFEYYVRPWVDDRAAAHDPEAFPHLDGLQARAIDAVIDTYNDAIIAAVRTARTEGLDWAVVDISGVLDRLAYRRWETDRPSWLKPYPLPPDLVRALGFTPDTRFLKTGPGGWEQGGLVALDGVHPTVSGYSVIARECIRVLQQLGIEVPEPEIDYAAVAAADELLSNQITALTGDLAVLDTLDKKLHLLAFLERTFG